MASVFVPIAFFGFLSVTVYFRHQRAMMQMRLMSGQHADSNLAAELQALKHQIIELRDTTTRYDMSFDSALQRLESRVNSLESRSVVPAASPAPRAEVELSHAGTQD